MLSSNIIILIQYSGTLVIYMYPNPLGPGVVHKSEKSISLKLCINSLNYHKDDLFKIISISNTLIEQSLYSSRAVIPIVQLTKNLISGVKITEVPL